MAAAAIGMLFFFLSFLPSGWLVFLLWDYQGSDRVFRWQSIGVYRCSGCSQVIDYTGQQCKLSIVTLDINSDQRKALAGFKEGGRQRGQQLSINRAPT
jgi:hypothetical protein